jgi:transcriptional regulator with XRE-family HTH domain
MQELREATGLTQQQLADLTMLDRIRITMFENGLRPIPTKAMQQLVELFVLLPLGIDEQNLPFVNSELAEQTTAADKAVNNYKRLCSIKLYRKQKQLKALEGKYKQCITLLQVLRSYRKQLPIADETSYQHTWINVAEYEALDRLKTCSLAKQQVLQIQIEHLMIG